MSKHRSRELAALETDDSKEPFKHPTGPRRLDCLAGSKRARDEIPHIEIPHQLPKVSDATGAPDVPPRIPVEIDDKLRRKIARAATAAVDAGEGEDGDLFLFSLHGIDGKGCSSDEHVESDSHAGGGSSSENSSDSSDDDGSEDDRAHEASHRRTSSKSLASNKPMAKKPPAIRSKAAAKANAASSSGGPSKKVQKPAPSAEEVAAAKAKKEAAAAAAKARKDDIRATELQLLSQIIASRSCSVDDARPQPSGSRSSASASSKPLITPSSTGSNRSQTARFAEPAAESDSEKSDASPAAIDTVKRELKNPASSSDARNAASAKVVAVIPCYETRGNFTPNHIAALSDWCTLAGFLAETNMFGPRIALVHGCWVPKAALDKFSDLWFETRPQESEEAKKRAWRLVLSNINLHIRHALTHALRENVEAWKSFFSSTDDVVERPKPPPGPWPFDEENNLLSIEDYLDQFITFIQTCRDLNTIFVEWDTLVPFFRMVSRAAIKFPVTRIVVQFTTLLLVVAQGGKGKCAKVLKGDGSAASKDKVKQDKAEQQLPDSMGGALPSRLVAALKARTDLTFSCTDVDCDACMSPESNFVYKSLYFAVTTLINSRTAKSSGSHAARSSSAKGESSASGKAVAAHQTPIGTSSSPMAVEGISSRQPPSHVDSHRSDSEVLLLPAATGVAPPASGPSLSTAIASSADVKQRLVQLRKSLRTLTPTAVAVRRILDTVQRKSAVIEEVIDGVWEWSAPTASKIVVSGASRDSAEAVGSEDFVNSAGPLVPEVLQQDALEFLNELLGQCGASE